MAQLPTFIRKIVSFRPGILLFKRVFFSWKQTLLVLSLLLIPVFGYLIWRQVTAPTTLDSVLGSSGKAGQGAKEDLDKTPTLPISQSDGKFVIEDDGSTGFDIKYANQKDQSLTQEGPDAPKKTKLSFPKDYSQPIEIDLGEGKTITMKDETGTSKFNVETVKKDVAAQKLNIPGLPKQKQLQQAEQPDSLLSYSDGRKTILYGYQKDKLSGEKKLKSWTLYQKGSGSEEETYSFENAKLTLAGTGEVEVRYFGDQEKQQQQAMADVSPDLLERARKTLEKEGSSLDASKPADLVIPAPYFLDKDGNRHDATWQISDDQKTLTLSIKDAQKLYPIALDPTLSFTAPGMSNSGSVITGESSSYFGVSLVSGDFNADGKTDLAVGAYNYSSSTGRAYIFHNDGSIPTTAATADVIITGESSSSLFGYSLASGDFNADGKTDLAVGAYGYSSNAGRAYIFYNDGSIPTTAATADVIITGEATSNFGWGLVSGDFNADGKTDLAVGAYGYSSSAGRAYIFHNDGSIPTTAATADVIITGESSSLFGISLASGDFNADGKTDLAVGAYGYSSNAGRAYIFYNDGSIPTTAATADVKITGEATSYFGSGMASGDFNADGKTDLAVGAFNYSSSAGRAYIFYNDGSIPTTATTADVIITGEALSYFGLSFTAGDFNSDGKTDLAVGAYGYSSNAGRAYIFYNDGSIPTTAATADVKITGEATSYFGSGMASGDFNADGKTDLAVGAYIYSSDTGRTYLFYNDGSIPTTAATADVIITGESSSYFGYSLASGDFNADGKTDLAVGASYYSSITGRAYIFYSQNGQVNTNKSITGEASSSFGHSFAVGDFNADGKTDLAVGAYTFSSGTGRTYIFYNDSSFPGSSTNADTIITGESSSYFGRVLAPGDFNSDGRIDLAVSATEYSSTTGRVYIFYNDGSYPSGASSADVLITGAASTDFGFSLAAGDFNTDGKTDLAIGAIHYSSYTGRAYIFYQNSGGGFTTPLAATSADVLITGQNTGDYFGLYTTTGDFNADGKTDYSVATEFYSSSAGRAYIFYQNSGGGFTTPLAASSANVIISGEASSKLGGGGIGSGDLNTDGKTDLVVGADAYSSSAGRVYIFHQNSGGGFTTPLAATSANVIITGEAGSDFGDRLTVGDLNADGRTDLAVGAQAHSSNTGRAYIFYNDGSIPTTAATSDIILTGETAGGSYGRNITVGDFNADGRTDLVIGAYGYSSSAGRVYFYETRENFAWDLQNVGTAGSLRISPSTAGQEMKIGGETAATSQFGSSFTAGDFNADGKTDLAVGAPAYSSSTGRVYIFYDDGGTIPTSASSADVTITGESSSNFGSALTSGDFNADGKTDLAVGAYNYSSTAGRAYIFYNDGSIPTTAATADVIITGESTSDFGFSLAAGDFNADGKTDLAVGANLYSTYTGRAYIFYNDGSIPTTAATADVIITGEASSEFAYRMTSGDFNVDGKVDLAVGGDIYSANAGRAYIFYNDGSIPTTAASADVKITGESGSYFGSSLASGDLNADGKIDLVVGTGLYSTDTGRVYIFYNDGSIPTTAATADVIITGESGSRFGYPVICGDFNADGETDLAAGGRYYSSSTGRTYIFFNDGSISTTAATADIILTGEATSNYYGAALVSGDFNADGKTDLVVGAYGYSSSTGRAYLYTFNDKVGTGESSSGFGYSIASGDFNADGRIDLAVGANTYSSNTGRVYLFYNVVNGSVNASSADATITGEASSYFGYSISSGDFNTDGETDIVVGAYGYSSSAGRAYLFYNDGTYPTAATSADVIINGEAGSRFGSSMIAGDFNADGRSDIVVGAVYYSTGSGRIYIFHNDGSYPTAAASADGIITGELGSALYAFAVGDFNADGKTDLAAGAPYYSSSTGRTYIFYQNSGGGFTTPLAATSANVIVTGGATSDAFGHYLAAGDFDADGDADLAIGAYYAASADGRVYILYNDGSYPTTAATADVIIAGETDSGIGTNLAAGDFNADGRTDLAIGAYYYGASWIGRAYFVYNDGSYPESVASSDMIMTGESNGSYFGWPILASDLNGDGKTDFAIGAVGASSSAGRVYVVMTEAKTGVEQLPKFRFQGPAKARGPMIFH